MSTEAAKTPSFVVLLAWLVVAVPLGWGLYQSVLKAKPLFAGQSHTAPAQPAAAKPASP